MMLRRLAQQIPQWDGASKLGLGLGIALLILLLPLGFLGPEPIQLPAKIGAFGLLLTIQLLVLWGSRRALSPYHQAQRHFIAGDYARARGILEAIPDSGRPSVDALVLLGNAYRHLGQLEKSRAALERALGLKPQYPFALYGLGKLKLALGDYEAAGHLFTKALRSGAPDSVQFDLGQAYYLLGDDERAHRCFDTIRAIAADDPAQALLIDYYRWQMQGGRRPSRRAIRGGIGFWRQEAIKHQQTPYGAALQKDVDVLSAWLRGA